MGCFVVNGFLYFTYDLLCIIMGVFSVTDENDRQSCRP